MKVLLINPRYTSPLSRTHAGQPLGLAYLASSLQQHGHSVRILDADCPGLFGSEADFWATSFAESADLIGISVYTANWPVALHMARQLKWAFPKATLALGGPHATALHRDIVANWLEVDVSIRGDGELSLCELADRLEHGAPPTEVPGTTSRGPDGIIVGPPRRPVENLDELPMPARDLLPPPGQYIPWVGPSAGAAVHVNTSRGCPHRCSFCLISGLDAEQAGSRRWRSRSVGHVVEELSWLGCRYGAKHISFTDADFLVSVERAVGIAEGLQKAIPGATFGFACRADDVVRARHVLPVLAHAGCTSIELGLENLDDDELALMGKGASHEAAEDALFLLRKSGIEPLPSFILVTDATRPDQYLENLRMIRSLGLPLGRNLDWLFTTMEPLPGSPARERLAAAGKVGMHSFASPYYSVQPQMQALRSFLAMVRRCLLARMQSVADQVDIMASAVHQHSPSRAADTDALLRLADCTAIRETLVMAVCQAIERVASVAHHDPEIVHAELRRLRDAVAKIEIDMASVVEDYAHS